MDYDDTVLKTDRVATGADAIPPTDPVRSGYRFTGWRPAITNITADTTAYAQYELIDSEDKKHQVRFIDHDDTILSTQRVIDGQDAIEPKSPTREGYTFTGWRPAITNVTKDTDAYAQYEKKDSSSSDSSSGGSSNNGSSNGSNSGSTDLTSKLYTLTVRNGSGSGSYAAGAQVIIIANDPTSTTEFSNWTVDPATVNIASKNVTATVLTMPESAVTVTANYTNKSTTSGSGSNVSGNANGNSNSNTTTGTITNPNSNNGTTVVIDKNGLSNTGVVTAVVNGSSDNFVIKISESADAAARAVKALMAEYGDLSNIVYFPMDISLYDSTGTTKITDTTGLSIAITLPIPDSMITYAGNNKIASIKNDKLEVLSPKFTTISGVSCITFTAEHFSPYLIYVDKSNLTAGVITDTTPKTGDGIHPKWFLSIGLACIAIFLFTKKDKRKLAIS